MSFDAVRQVRLLHVPPRHRELLAPFGLDAGDPAFWQRGLGVVEGLIDELETLEAAP